MNVWLSSLGMVVVSAGIAGADPALLTFDDLPTPWDPVDGSYNAPIPEGYGGLSWINFHVLDAVDFPNNPSGYLNGMVSSPNVAVNWGALPSGMKLSSGLFDLDSAYLTAAWTGGLSVEVQGFRNGVVIYDHFYTLSQTSPTLIQFDYTGVSKVLFFAGSQFGLDNLVVTVPEPAAGAVLVLGWALVRAGQRRTKR
jgi:hypothetical protein